MLANTPRLMNVFSNRTLRRVPVIAFKSHGGAQHGWGGLREHVERTFWATFARRDQTVPACATSRRMTGVHGPSVATGKPRAASIRATLTRPLGFGGAILCRSLCARCEPLNRTDGGKTARDAAREECCGHVVSGICVAQCALSCIGMLLSRKR